MLRMLGGFFLIPNRIFNTFLKMLFIFNSHLCRKVSENNLEIEGHAVYQQHDIEFKEYTGFVLNTLTSKGAVSENDS